MARTVANYVKITTTKAMWQNNKQKYNPKQSIQYGTRGI